MSDIEPTAAPGDANMQAEFRRQMGLFTTGVCVVSVPGGRHGVTAMTVNSLVSVSLDPMLVCWSLQNDASLFETYRDAGTFAVSILAETHADLARRYAARGDALLRASDFETSANGLPVIEGALGYIECSRWSHYLAGDHTMIFGEVIGMKPRGAGNEENSPLGFFNGKFCSIGP